MKRVLAVVLALVLVGCVGWSASAAEAAKGASGPGGGMVQEGAERLAIVGSADYGTTYGDLTATGTSLSAAAEYGYMVLDQLELAVRGMFALTQLQVASANANYRAQNYAIDLVPKWRPAVEGNISPFIGPKVGVRYVTNSATSPFGRSSASDTVFEWGAVLGVDIFLGKNVALVVEYDYTQYNVKTPITSLGVPLTGTLALAAGSGNITVRDHALTAGLAYWW